MKLFDSLFKRKKLPVTIVSNAHHGINGYDAEKMAASLAILAAGGEIQWASRTEEGSKIDFVLSFDNPVYPGNRLIIQAQVKSGHTYGARTDSGGFTLTARAKRETRRESKPSIVFWNDRISTEFYWAYLHPRTKIGQQKYGIHHEVSPALRYDLARCEGNIYLTAKGGKGIFFKTSGEDFKILRAKAKTTFKSLKGKCFSPIFGNINCTRVAWRHIFRMTRSLEDRRASCMVIDHLKDILAQHPSTLLKVKPSIITDIHPSFHIRKTEFILHYRLCGMYDHQKHDHVKKTVVVRLIEEIRYPANWRTNGITSQLIERNVTLLSCYILRESAKEKKKRKSKIRRAKKKRKK